MPTLVAPEALHSPPPEFRPRRTLVPALLGIAAALWLGGSDACFDGGAASSATLEEGAQTSPFNITGGGGADPATGTTTGVDSGALGAGGSLTTGNTTMGNTTTSPVPVTGAARFGTVGRFSSSNNGTALSFSVPGTRLGVSFVGTSLSVTISDTGIDGLNVYVDGGNATVLQLNATTSPVVYPVVSNLSQATHTVWFERRNEMMQGAGDGNTGSCGVTTVWDVATDSTGYFIAAPQGRARRIEAMGDSSFNGYGVEILCGNNSSQPNNSCGYIGNGYSPRTQNVAKSVPGVVARSFNADLSNISSSGQGVIWSYYDSGNCNVASNILQHCLPTLWRETVPPASSPNFSFYQQMDVVLMSVGGDDITAQSTFPAGTPAFVNGVASWVGEIRSRYPTSTIVLVLSAAADGNDITVLGGALQQAVSTAQAAQPGGTDPNILYFNYFTGTSYKTYSDIANQLGYGYGSSGHPSTAGSLWLGQRLAAFVGQHMGWTVGTL